MDVDGVCDGVWFIFVVMYDCIEVMDFVGMGCFDIVVLVILLLMMVGVVLFSSRLNVFVVVEFDV
ncbi:MAG: hypothetical protein O7C59_11650 [Rickettsia endosymbiont of Ixodes persulcatus]|nr:hypothetical protein [Rickettsia endosymbiont of Ixodes persulcatus]